MSNLLSICSDTAHSKLFCGSTYLEAVDFCSVETYCRTGKHIECPGVGLFCWPGVTCNIQDMIEPTTRRPSVSPIISPNPTKSPAFYDDPQNVRVCGSSWVDASSSCKDGKQARWCSNGSDDECDDGEQCWADTSCNILDFTFPPSYQPTDNPTETVKITLQPTNVPIKYNDPINTSFCGNSYEEARTNCSLETHCPNVVHADCSGNMFCWTVDDVSCNIHNFIVVTPSPTIDPSPAPLLTPITSNPTTSAPTKKTTQSPLLKADERNSFFCGISREDASSKCNVQCPHLTGE